MRRIVQLSGGKDSTALLLMCIHKNYRVDEAVFFDTGMEFNAVYKTIDYLEVICKGNGIKLTKLYPRIPFKEKMFNIEVHKRDGSIGCGYSWCGGVCRWGTTDKLQTLESYCKGSIELIGIAFDEQFRLAKKRKGNKEFPLSTWKITEHDALNYCYDNGIYWVENAGAGDVRLYDILDRVSCWCCGNKNLKELRNMYKYLPDYWEKLKEYQGRTNRPFRRNGKTIFDLEDRFRLELTK